MMLQSPSRWLVRSIAAFSHVGFSPRGKSGSFCRAFLSALIHVFPLSCSCLLLSISLVFTFLPLLFRHLFLISFSAAARSLLFHLGAAPPLCLLSTALPLCCSSSGLPLLVVFLIFAALPFFLLWFLFSQILQLLVKVLLLFLHVLLFLPLLLFFILSLLVFLSLSFLLLLLLLTLDPVFADALAPALALALAGALAVVVASSALDNLASPLWENGTAWLVRVCVF